jgi:hypothetical protein
VTNSLLPTQKSAPSLSPDRAKTLLYGPPKVGKSTLASLLNPEHTIFISTEPGLDGLEVFKTDVRDWETFRKVGAELAEGGHQFTTTVIDTVDELHTFCSEAVCQKLDITHPSDLEYGKGWKAVSDEFALRIGKLTTLGGVVLISHSKEIEIKRRVGSVTKSVPNITGASREWMLGFVDYILYADVEQTPDGEKRQIRTSLAENYEAGCRGVQLPDPLPMDGHAVREAMEKATAELQAQAANGKAEAKKPAAKPAAKASATKAAA